MAIGGSIESVTLAGREFAVAADADASRDLGGFTKTIEPNGNGTARTVMTRKPWKIEGLTLSTDDDRADQEFLQDIADNPNDVAIAITEASGAVYQGVGSITDDLTKGTQNATTGVTLMGPGKLTKQ